MNLTPELTSERLAGLAHATAKYNADKKSEHDATQAQKPEGERVAYVAITDEAYAVLRVGGMLDSYFEQYLDAAKRENESVLADAILYLSDEQKANLKSQIASAKASA